MKTILVIITIAALSACSPLPALDNYHKEMKADDELMNRKIERIEKEQQIVKAKIDSALAAQKRIINSLRGK